MTRPSRHEALREKWKNMWYGQITPDDVSAVEREVDATVLNWDSVDPRILISAAVRVIAGKER